MLKFLAEAVHASEFTTLQFGGAGDKPNAKLGGQTFNPQKIWMAITQKRFELES